MDFRRPSSLHHLLSLGLVLLIGGVVGVGLGHSSTAVAGHDDCSVCLIIHHLVVATALTLGLLGGDSYLSSPAAVRVAHSRQHRAFQGRAPPLLSL